jgi:hypothetical protein
VHPPSGTGVPFQRAFKSSASTCHAWLRTGAAFTNQPLDGHGRRSTHQTVNAVVRPLYIALSDAICSISVDWTEQLLARPPACCFISSRSVDGKSINTVGASRIQLHLFRVIREPNVALF